MRLPRSHRITRWGDFQRVRKEGKSVAGRYLVLGVLADPAVPHFQLGLITSKKVGNAVTRNRVRRRLRAVVRELGEDILPGHRLVTIARFRAGRATYDELRDEWRQLAQKSGVLPDSEQRP